MIELTYSVPVNVYLRKQAGAKFGQKQVAQGLVC